MRTIDQLDVRFTMQEVAILERIRQVISYGVPVSMREQLVKIDFVFNGGASVTVSLNTPDWIAAADLFTGK